MHLLQQTYTTKKQAIEERLTSFSRLSSDDIFYEFCFCLLTPQSKGKFCWEKVQKLKSLGFKERSFDPHTHIKDMRFHHHKNKYLLAGKKIFPQVLQQLATTQDSNQLRAWLAQNVDGYGYKEASLPYDEKVLIIINNEISFMEIGKLFDLFTSGKLNKKTIKTLAFDPKSLKFEVATVTKIFKHNYKKDMYEINLKTGRKVKVTGDHSLFTLHEGEVIPIAVRNLKIGSYIAVPKSIKHRNFLTKELNLIDIFLNLGITHQIYLRSKSYCKYLKTKYQKKIKRRNQYTQFFRGIVPINLLKKLPKDAYSVFLLKKYDVKIGTRRSSTTINSIIKPNRDFFWILGLLVAEGYVERNPIEFTLGIDEELRHKRLNILLNKVFGVRVKSYKPYGKNAYTSKVNNYPFFYLINEVLGIKGTKELKKFPKIVYSASYDCIVSFLQGYWEGDGWKKSKSYLSISTVSEDLACGILISFLMIGVMARHCLKRKNHTIDVNNIIQPTDVKKRAFVNKTEVIPFLGDIIHQIHKDLRIRSRIKGKHTPLFNKLMRWKSMNEPSRNSLKKVIDLFEKQRRHSELVKVKKLVYSDLSFIKIKRIKKIKYNKKYVYDLEVNEHGREYQNFVGGFGGVCLHNSHFLRNIGYRNLAILDRHILKNLVHHGVLLELPKTLTPKKYLDIEQLFQQFAKNIQIPMDALDLLFWSNETGEIFK